MVETARSVKAMRVDSRSQDLDPQVEEQVRYKPEETPVTLAAKSSSLGRAYMNWARFPITETEPLESGGRGYVVRFKDLRFELAGRRADYSPWAIVRLNRDLTVSMLWPHLQLRPLPILADDEDLNGTVFDLTKALVENTNTI
jgi:hypothetical protein